MTGRIAGVSLMVAGLLIAIVGLIGMLSSGGGDQPEATGSTEPRETTTSMPASTTTLGPPATTTTTIAITTTEPVDQRPGIELFVVAFSQAIEAGDVEFLYSTLHPAVIAVYDETTCRTFITDEILLLRDYRLTGPLDEPVTESIGGMTFQSYAGPVAFTFQGQDFEAQASFAVEADGPKWFGTCAE